MNKVAIFAICLALASCAHIHEDMKEIVETVNKAGTTWTAGFNPRHEGFTMESLKGQLGSLPENVHEKLPAMVHEVDESSIPDSFDARTAWPNCESVSEIRDQSACGSCWAFGAVEAMSDRICIASGQKDQTRISSEDLVSCCKGIFACGNGCNGGYPSAAWTYYKNKGLVSGGLYDDNSMCQPYAFAPCAHHTHSSEYPDCPSATYSTPSCSKSCVSESGLDFNSDLRKGASSYSVSGVSNIQTEIMTNGPVEVSFTVYSDFEAYTGGVYQHTSGSQLGGHAVKALGWGVDNGTPYWIIANSWNPSWGENGYFRILRGSNECGIEGSVVAGAAPKSDLFLN